MEMKRQLHSEFDYYALANGFGLEVQLDDAPGLELFVRLFRDFRTDEQILLLNLPIRSRDELPAILEKLTDSQEFFDVCVNFDALSSISP